MTQILSNRDHFSRLFSNRAAQDAESLYKAGAGKWGTDEKTFNAIFTQRSYPQLRATFEEYQKVIASTTGIVLLR